MVGEKIYQLLAVEEPALLTRLLRCRSVSGVTIVLDLEDGVGDVYEPTRDVYLKRCARKNAADFLASTQGRNSRVPLGLRPNAFQSEEWSEDVRLLASLHHSHIHPCLFMLPKVESGNNLLQMADDIVQAGHGNVDLMPMVETRRGMENLSGILAAAQKLGVRDVVYGHYDYCLDSETFPFPQLDQLEYWTWFVAYLKRLEASGLSHVQYPFLFINDDHALLDIRQTLRETCTLPFSMLTISFRQSAVLATSEGGAGPSQGRSTITRTGAEIPPGQKRQEAWRVIGVFEQQRRAGQNFAVDALLGRFVSKHEYLCALRYVAEGKD